MKGFIAIVLALVVVIIFVGGAVAFTSMNGNHEVSKIINKVSNIESSSGSSNVGDIVKVVKEEIIESGQQEGLTYRQVSYSDGGFRQYDVKTGELIGSSYDSDQDKLPKMD
ncbi:hypothetical protein [Methanobrevibacter sp.]|uniref:hypothetical protein n=1 Tax=Methanobrevibacter sp. TaxID=66852 RepID=UPI00388E1794